MKIDPDSTSNTEDANCNSTDECEFDTIYVDGRNCLFYLKQDDANRKVRLIEDKFMKRMWNVEGLA